MTLHVTTTESLAEVCAQDWDALLGPDPQPFLTHTFLYGLERHGCVGESQGWQPRHLLVQDAGGRLVGATPLYVKTHSYGELVFDWAWADAYARHGRAYYPKAVGAVPFTPVSGPRLLVHPDAPTAAVRSRLVAATLAEAQGAGWSGVHWLFARPDETRLLEREGGFLRVDLQYHWDNPGYASWEDFLKRLRSKRRKEIRRERERVRQQGLAVRVVHGDEATEADLDAAHALYAALFDRKYGYPTLTRAFFRDVGPRLGTGLVLFFAEARGRPVAVAICLRDARSLYGRYWGSAARHDCLHFELCYYQGIQYCIEHGLSRFEPGAQGEHKIPRGFLPMPTWSAHWIADPGFAEALRQWSLREQAAVLQAYEALMTASPYRRQGRP